MRSFNCKFSKYLSGVLVSLAVITLTTSAAAADPYGCVKDLNDKLVRWESNWGDDGFDENIVYEVLDVSRASKGGMLVELSAYQPARTPRRWLRINNAILATNVCRRSFPKLSASTSEVIKDRKSLNEIKKKAAISLDKLRELPFIRFSTGGWVRANRVTNQQLSVCRIGAKFYSCIFEEKNRYGGELTHVAEEMQVEVSGY